MNNVVQLEEWLTEEEKRWVTRRELAAEWRVSVQTIDRLRDQGLPVETWGRRLLRFNLAECERWRRRRRSA